MSTKQPAKEFRYNGISLALWENTGKNGNRFYGASLKKHYKDDSGKWQDTDNFSEYDLPAMLLVIQNAANELVTFKKNGSGKGEKEKARNEMTELIKKELDRIIGTGEEKKEFKETYTKEVMKKLGILKDYEATDTGDKALIYSYLVKEEK